MEHSDAVRLHAAEKYALGELSSQLRDEYEEHYFGCQACASEVKMTAVFMDGSRTILKAEPETEKPVVEASGWFDWLQPRFAIPVLATLLLVVGYQNFVTIPQLKTMSSTGSGVDGDFVSLIGANSRSESLSSIQLHQSKPAILEVDIPTSGEFTGYVCRLQNQEGQSVYEAHISSADVKKSVHLIVPRSKLQSQKYTLAVFGQGASNSAAPAETEVERLAFAVEIIP